MRLFSIISAVVVMIVLFFVVLQRDALFAFAGAEARQDQAEPEAFAPQDQSGEDIPDTAIHVLTRRIVAQPLETAVILRGRTEALRQVDVRAETQGRVISDPLRKGSYVDADALLCRLDPGSRLANLTEARARVVEARARGPETQARVAEARARLEEAQINATAANRLSEEGFASTTRVANAAASLSSAQAALSAAEAGLQSVEAGIQSAQAAEIRAADEITKLDIKAPFAGLLESDSAELGSLMQQGGLCATIIQLDPIKLVGFVPETDVARITVGAPAKARLISGQEVAGRVTFLSRSADPTTRTFRVEMQVPNPDLALRDGQSAEIGIATDGASAHLLPASSLTLNDEGRFGVRLVDETSTVRFAPIEMLRDTAQGVWVAGLPEEANVIIRGQEYVTAGVRVHTTQADEATSDQATEESAQ